MQPFDSTLEPPRMLTPEVVVLYRDKREEAEGAANESRGYEWPAEEPHDKGSVAVAVPSAEVGHLCSWIVCSTHVNVASSKLHFVTVYLASEIIYNNQLYSTSETHLQ